MHAPLVRLGLPLLSLSLLLAACGGTVTPPPTGTPITSLADSGPGTLRDLLDNAGAGDTLRLDSGTITLTGPLKVTKSVTLNLGSSVIDANGQGRVLEIPGGVTVTITGGTLKGGTGAPLTVQGIGPQELTAATYGGVLLNEGTLTLDGTTVTGGEANRGGGIANLKTGTLTLKGTANVTGNMAQALPADATESSGGGGGLFNAGALMMEGGAVNGNSALYAGGGIYAVKTATMTIQGGSIDNNTCTYPRTVQEETTEGCVGGGIYASSSFTLSSGTIRGNTSTLQGGGVYMVSSVDGAGTITGSTLTMSGGEISGNTTFNAGGGILLGQAVTMNLSGGSILNNKVTDTGNAGGGGILAYKATLKMSGGTVGGNSALTGGGIDAFTATTVEISGGTLENNRTIANGNGGGINVNSGSTLKFTGGTIQNNITEGGGGGIAISHAAGLLTMSGTAAITGNTAQDGGGVAVYGAKMDLSGGSIQGNQASRTGGGIVDGGSLVMTGGEISGNKSTGTTDGGGGVRIFRDAKLTLAGGKISGNTSPYGGGGITADGEVIMTGGEISGNAVTAKDHGGGGVQLYSAGKMTASGGTISGNRAPFAAGVYVNGPYQTSPTAEFILSGASVTGNVVTDATNKGGGFFNEGKLTITSGSVTGNTATQHGGGVFNRQSATYAQPGGSVTGNTPDDVFNEP